MALNKTESGMVTAETAVTIPAVILVAGLLVAALLNVGMRANACAYAFTAARAYAVGEIVDIPARWQVKVVDLGNQWQAQVGQATALSKWLPVECSVSVWKEPEL